jgi:hypothetical protein
MFVRDPFFTLCTTCDAPAVWCLPSKKPVACEDAEHRLLHMTANACALIGAPNTETWGRSRVELAGAKWESPLTCEHLERPILVYRILVSFPDDPLAKLVASCALGVTMLHVAIFNFVHGSPSDAASSPPGMASLPVMTSKADTLQQFRPRPCPRSLILYPSFRDITTLFIFRSCHIFSLQIPTVTIAFSNILFPKRIIGNCAKK